MEAALSLTPSPAPTPLPAGNDHPVVDVPFTAIIDGRQLRGRGLSLVAAYVSGLIDPQVLHSTRIVRLVFEFDGFSVALVVEAKVRDDADGSGVAELTFIHPTGPHLPQLRHILNAFIAGDLVGLGQTLGVAGVGAPRGPVPPPRAESRLSPRRIAGGLGVGLLTLALVAAAGTLAFQRSFVTLLPALGTVVTTGEVLRATATGQIAFLDLAAAQGDVAVAIQANSGDVHSLLMPCDCVLTATGLREGSTVLVGEPVAQLSSATDRRVVAALIPAAALFDLLQADRVDLTFPDGMTIPAQPVAGPMNPGSGDLWLVPAVPLDAARIGQPVEIRIRHDAGPLGVLHDAMTGLFDTSGRGV